MADLDPQYQGLNANHFGSPGSKITPTRLAHHVELNCSAMSIDRRKTVLFGAAALLRLLLFVSFPSLSDLLGGRVEISTPVTSFKRCEYCLFALKNTPRANETR